MFSSIRAGFTHQRTLALGGALGAAGLASIWLVSDAFDDNADPILVVLIDVSCICSCMHCDCNLSDLEDGLVRKAQRTLRSGAKCFSRQGT